MTEPFSGTKNSCRTERVDFASYSRNKDGGLLLTRDSCVDNCHGNCRGCERSCDTERRTSCRVSSMRFHDSQCISTSLSSRDRKENFAATKIHISIKYRSRETVATSTTDNFYQPRARISSVYILPHLSDQKTELEVVVRTEGVEEHKLSNHFIK